MSAQDAAEKCPVDHKTRQAWLDKAKAASQAGAAAQAATQAATQAQSPLPPHPVPPPPPPSTAHVSAQSMRIPTRFSLDLGREVPILPPGWHQQPRIRVSGLATDREISTIPRATLAATAELSTAGTHSPANNEQESGADSSGNWVYPSEQMFFEAMKRKNFDPQAQDMRSIVPIHNAVNEQAWKEIKKWEKGRGAEACGGPRLVSFSGQYDALTPKARLNSILGYTKPFDRHDWVIDRCGTQIDYVIDFYAGKDEGKPGKSLNFYLDVRPKVNTLEGCKMRIAHFFGM